MKGTDIDIASKDHIAKNTIPAVYLDYLMKHYFRAVDSKDRPDYSEYDKEMDTKRSQKENSQLSAYR